MIRLPGRISLCLSKESPVTGKRLSTISTWLGLFAMVMIHVGPLSSAIQLLQAPSAQVSEQHHAEHRHGSSAHEHHQRHQQASPGEPTWLSVLALCGYCELLTVNPPLTLSVDLVLPNHAPAYFQPLPEQPRPSAPRRGSGYPRAPPHNHS